MNTVVIVDNSREMLNSYKRMLESDREEINCRYFRYPEEAVDYIRKEGAAVLVCELELPIMSGKEVFDMVEMLSPDTVKVAMAQVTDVRKTLDIMNQSRIFKLILKPFFLAEDILEPIKASLKYYEMQKKEKDRFEDDTEEMDVPNKKTRKLVDELERKKQTYYSIYKTMTGMVESNLQNGNMNLSEKEQEDIINVFAGMFREFMRYYMFGKQNYIFHINYLMNFFQHKEENKEFQMKNNMGKEIPDEILQEMAYTIFMAGYIFKEIFWEYCIRGMIDEEEEEYVLMLSLETSEENGRYKMMSGKVRKVMIQMAEKVIDIFAERTIKGKMQNPLEVKIYYKKGEKVL